jgi:hypothetical protein
MYSLHDISLSHQLNQINAAVQNECHSLVQCHGLSQQYVATYLDSFNEQVQRTLKTYNQSLQNLRHDIQSLAHRRGESSNSTPSTTFISACNNDSLARMFRSEMQHVLRPIVERSLSRLGTGNEALHGRPDIPIDSMSKELGHQASRRNQIDDELSFQPSELHNPIENDRNCKPVQTTPAPEDSDTHINHFSRILSQPNSMTTSQTRCFKISKQRRCLKWPIGTIVVEVEKIGRRVPYMAEGYEYHSIYVTFIPTTQFSCLPAFSMAYTTAPDNRGLYQLAPSIRSIPIISGGHLIWSYIQAGDLEGVRRIIGQEGLSPNSQTDTSLSIFAVRP